MLGFEFEKGMRVFFSVTKYLEQGPLEIRLTVRQRKTIVNFLKPRVGAFYTPTCSRVAALYNLANPGASSLYTLAHSGVLTLQSRSRITLTNAFI
jgi:hypothetical protein